MKITVEKRPEGWDYHVKVDEVCVGRGSLDGCEALANELREDDSKAYAVKEAFEGRRDNAHVVN